MRHITLLLAALTLAVAAPALAGKGGNGGGNGAGNGSGGGNAGNNGGGGGGSGSGGSRYYGTLVASPNVLHAGDYFDVSGCGYDTALGNVIVSFTGGSWGSALDSGGCFTITGIPALSGDTLPAGTYEVTASQYVRGEWAETGETTVTVVE
jgi:hypothetical protein